jgi:hypothetical protein
VVRKFIGLKIPAPAICGPTVFLARHGLVENKSHTSNGSKYLKNLIGEYPGSELYLNHLSISSNGIITANDIASVEFARDILAELNIYDAKTLKSWYDFFKTPGLDD